MERKFDLDERLIDFASGIIDVAESLPKTQAGNHIAGQIIRSGTGRLHYIMDKHKAGSQEQILFIK